jgi:hypothetical protein
MAYGTIKVDTITFTDGGVDKSVSVSGLVENPTFTGNVTATGTISGNTVRGQTISGVTVTGTTAQFTSGTFVSLTGTTLQGTTATYTTGSFTSLTGTTTSGTTANFVSGVFSTQISGVTVTGTTANFTSGNFTNISGGTHTITSGVFAAGTAANPSISFVSDPNTGIYSPGADQVAISTGGTGRLFVDASGRVGIGAALPNGLLDLVAAENSTALSIASWGAARWISSVLQWGGINSGEWTTAAFYTGGNERMRLDSSGRLGLGTSSPSARCEIAYSSTAPSLSSNSGAGLALGGTSSVQLNFGTNPASPFNAWIQTRDTGTNSAFPLAINPLGGNVGIGTTSPSYVLDARGAVASTSAGGIQTVLSFASDGIVGTISNHSLTFFANNAEKARIDTSGRLLVGTSTARTNVGSSGQDPLFQTERVGGSGQHVCSTRNANDEYGPSFALVKSRGTTAGSYALVSQNDGIGSIGFMGTDGVNAFAGASISAFIDGTPGTNDMPGRLVFSTTADGASSPSQAMVIKNDQAILMTTSTASTNSTGWYGVQTDTSVGAISISRNGSNVLAFFHTSNSSGISGAPVGTVSITTTATTYATSSDYRLKENVVPLTGAIDRINKLKPSQFNFIADPDKTVDGFIAHEAQEVVPECTTGTKDEVDDDGNPVYQGIDQSKIVPLVVAALQEAIGRIESLEAEVAALKAQ